jgi:hypothetical protein
MGNGDEQSRIAASPSSLGEQERSSSTERHPSSPKFASKDTPLRWPKARSRLQARRAMGGRLSRIAKSHALSKNCDRAFQEELWVHRSHAEREASLLVDPNFCRITSRRS